MSFSTEIKQELNNSNSLANKENIKFELIGYLISGNCNVVKGKNIKFSTENDYNINRFSKILANIDINHKIDVNGKSFNIITKSLDINQIGYLYIKDNKILLNEDIKKIEQLSKSEEKKKSLIKGTFLGAGSINNPENTYHLEITFSNKENVDFIKELFDGLNIKVKKLETKNKYSLYIKEGEEISKFLALIGANKAVLKFEDVRIQKEMRGKINRIVNCETANLNKTINAAVEQITAIKKIKEEGRFNKLEENLKELADLRLKNPNMSLVELGKLLKKPIGKSGVNYRLKKIMEIANGK